MVAEIKIPQLKLAVFVDNENIVLAGKFAQIFAAVIGIQSQNIFIKPDFSSS